MENGEEVVAAILSKGDDWMADRINSGKFLEEIRELLFQHYKFEKYSILMKAFP